MLGERSDQRGLWEADRLYLDHVGRDTFYGLLASLRGRLFRDPRFRRVLLRRQRPGQRAAQPAGDSVAAPVSRQGERRRGQGPGRLRHPVEEPALGHDRGWPWGLRWKTVPSPRARCRCSAPS